MYVNNTVRLKYYETISSRVQEHVSRIAMKPHHDFGKCFVSIEIQKGHAFFGEKPTLNTFVP